LTCIEDIKERKKHILEKMLFMCELNKKNVFITKQIFDIHGEYKLNIYQGDTLLFDPVVAFGISHFDIIVGNPPYNKGGIRSHTGKQLSVNNEKNETIWPNFVSTCLTWLKDDGFLVFITPLSWLKKSHSLHKTLLSKHIIWMKLWDNMQSKKMINAVIPISLYILKNTLNIEKNKTEIISNFRRRNLTTLSNEYLNKDYSIPLAYHTIFNKLTDFIEKNNLKLEYHNKTVKSIGTKKRVPLSYNLKDNLAVDTITIKDGIMVKTTNEIHLDADKDKLIIANKSSFIGSFIDNSRLSLTGSDKFYILGENLELILKMLNFKISYMICHYTKYRQDFLEKEVFSYLPDIRKLNIKDINENEFYKLIGLTDNEIKSFDIKK
jgi:hypothetical protein